MKLGRIALVFLSLSCAGALVATGCSRQGEGERCSLDNPEEGEDSDCADGLICTDVEGVSGNVCCPKEGQPTELACIPVSGGSGGSGTGGSTSSGTGGSTGGSTAAGGAGGATGGGTASGGSGGSGGAAGGAGGSGGAAGGAGGSGGS